MKVKNNIPRRNFLKTASAAVIGAPYIVPSSVFGANAPSNRFTVGCIGMGGRGISDMTLFLARDDVQVTAVCDVDKSHHLDAKKLVEETYAEKTSSGTFKGCDDYNDFREIIDRKDIDLVLIATPDHWHAIPAIMAADAGKDIYCEKPLGLTIAEEQAMCDAVRRNGTVWQTGSQQRSDYNFRFGCELVRNGRIGKLHSIEVIIKSMPPLLVPPPEMPVPEGFDYNFWLGPAPWAPYTERRCHFNFRWILDYSGGILSDWAGHHCDIAHWGMDTENTGPIEIEGRGDYPREGLWDAATHFHFVCKYANGMTMNVYSDTPDKMGVRFIGTDGWIYVKRWEINAEPKSLLTSIIGRDEIHLGPRRRVSDRRHASDKKQVTGDNQSTGLHIANFIDCVRSRELTVTPIDILHRSVSIASLGNAAMQLKRKVRWDPDNERYIDDPEANRMLSRSMRSPWRLDM